MSRVSHSDQRMREPSTHGSSDVRILKCLADQVASFARDMRILYSKKIKKALVYSICSVNLTDLFTENHLQKQYSNLVYV